MNTRWWPVVACTLIAMALIGITASTAHASDCGPLEVIQCTTDGGGATLGLQDLGRLRTGLNPEDGKPNGKSYEYTSTYACPFSTPGGSGEDVMCVNATQGCAGNTPAQGQGPLVRLYQRELDASGKPMGAWALLGTTCYPDLVPGKPVLGMGQILAAFHNTAFTKPTVHIQPEGNLTLVTLATYFETLWPHAGFKPGEIDTTTMLGRRVQIRPTVQAYTYVFGDGQSFGPTPSPGGIYPNGDITHTYPKAGVYQTRIDITYSGQFRVNTGPWLPIPDTATIQGTNQPLTVKTAHARLVN